MSESLGDYPFLAEWLERQSEPMPDFGASVFDNAEPSPLAIDRIPEMKTETLFERKEQR